MDMSTIKLKIFSFQFNLLDLFLFEYSHFDLNIALSKLLFSAINPYVTWVLAFNELVRHFLIDSRDRLVKKKTEIQEAVGNNGKA